MPEAHGPNLWIKKEVTLSTPTGPGLKRGREDGILGLPLLYSVKDGPMGYFPVQCLYKTSHLRKEMADAGVETEYQPKHRTQKKKKLTKLSFQMHFGGRGKSKMEQVLPEQT